MSGGASIDVGPDQLGHAPSFWRAICSIPLFGMAKNRRDCLFSRYQQNATKRTEAGEFLLVFSTRSRAADTGIQQYDALYLLAKIKLQAASAAGTAHRVPVSKIAPDRNRTRF
ncbi:hypothetical protein ACVMGC_004991 [Bradyrhizobium barranii subsp. barranii]